MTLLFPCWMPRSRYNAVSRDNWLNRLKLSSYCPLATPHFRASVVCVCDDEGLGLDVSHFG